LFLAIKSRAHKIVRLLVEQGGCNINAADGDGDTPLHLSLVMAADNGPTSETEFLDTAMYLIEQGANAVLRNQRGAAALDVCPPRAFDKLKSAFVSAQVQTLLENRHADGAGVVKVGWRVRVRRAVDEPMRGWQGIDPEDVLVVRDVEGDDVVATFVDPDIPLRFRQGEVERVFDTSGARLSASTNGAAVDNVFNPDRELYWQSDGERGMHWVQIELPQV